MLADWKRIDQSWNGEWVPDAHLDPGKKPTRPAACCPYTLTQRAKPLRTQNLMKLGHTRRAQIDLPEAEKPPIRKFKVWVLGMVIFIIGNVLNFVSFGEHSLYVEHVLLRRGGLGAATHCQAGGVACGGNPPVPCPCPRAYNPTHPTTVPPALTHCSTFPPAAFAAQSLLAALGSLQLVCNVFFAYMVNKEPVRISLVKGRRGCVSYGLALVDQSGGGMGCLVRYKRGDAGGQSGGERGCVVGVNGERQGGWVGGGRRGWETGCR